MLESTAFVVTSCLRKIIAEVYCAVSDDLLDMATQLDIFLQTYQNLYKVFTVQLVLLLLVLVFLWTTICIASSGPCKTSSDVLVNAMKNLLGRHSQMLVMTGLLLWNDILTMKVVIAENFIVIPQQA
jgi:hypothetical protein